MRVHKRGGPALGYTYVQEVAARNVRRRAQTTSPVFIQMCPSVAISGHIIGLGTGQASVRPLKDYRATTPCLLEGGSEGAAALPCLSLHPSVPSSHLHACFASTVLFCFIHTATHTARRDTHTRPGPARPAAPCSRLLAMWWRPKPLIASFLVGGAALCLLLALRDEMHGGSGETSLPTRSAVANAVTNMVAYVTQGNGHGKPGLRGIGPQIRLTRANLHKEFAGLIDAYLAPWLPMEETPEARTVSTDMFDYVERRFYGVGIRVRVFQGRVFFRNVFAYEQPFYYSRMRFHLNIIQDAVKRFRVNGTEFFLNLTDGPRAGIDTSAPIPGFPIFGHDVSDAHIDIAIPDSMEYGAYGKYATDAVPSIPWEDKEPRLFFRGATTNFDMVAHNWHVSPRVRAAQLSAARADGKMDMGISRWSHVRNPSVNVTGEEDLRATWRDVVNDTGLTLAFKTALEEQCLAKWLLLLDGGWGGSRRAAILRCGSVLVQQDSPWRAFYSPLLVEGEHFVRVDRHLRNLTAVVEYLAAHDEEAEQIAANGKAFADLYLTRDAAVEYWGLLLQRWTPLFAAGQNFKPEDVPWDYCTEQLGCNEQDIQEKLRTSVLNCSKGWQEFTSLEAYDAMYAGTPAVP